MDSHFQYLLFASDIYAEVQIRQRLNLLHNSLLETLLNAIL